MRSPTDQVTHVPCHLASRGLEITSAEAARALRDEPGVVVDALRVTRREVRRPDPGRSTASRRRCRRRLGCPERSPLMSAPTGLVTRARSRPATGDVEFTSAEVTRRDVRRPALGRPLLRAVGAVSAFGCPARSPLMSAPTGLVTRARNRLASGGLEITAAEVARAVREEPGEVCDARRMTRREFVGPKPALATVPNRRRRQRLHHPARSPLMSAPTDLVTRVSSRLASSSLETTSAEVARAVREEPCVVVGALRVTRRDRRHEPVWPMASRRKRRHLRGLVRSLMSAQSDLVTCVRSRLASSGLQATSAEVTHRESVGANPSCPLLCAASAFVVLYGVG